MVVGAADWWARATAIIGAVAALGALGWNVYTWRLQHRVSLKVRSMYNALGPTRWYVALTIKNRGARPVTITEIKRQRRGLARAWRPEEDSGFQWIRDGDWIVDPQGGPLFPLELPPTDEHRLKGNDPMADGVDPIAGRPPLPADVRWVFRVVLDDRMRFRSKPDPTSRDRGMYRFWRRSHRRLPAEEG
jgi:hypothetical protein